MTGVILTINGQQYQVPSNISATTSLIGFIRDHANLRGTKSMCYEGGCGACIVSVKSPHPVTKEMQSYAVNSCLVSVLSCHGWEVTTVEGLGDKIRGYSEIQKRLAHFHGTQCGYCSPGMVMNMNSLLEDNENITMKEVENSFGGNICRCTGYRPILDAFKSLCSDADDTLVKKYQDIEDLDKIKTCPKTGTECSRSCSGNVPKNFSINVKDSIWHKVETVEDVLNIFKSIGEASYMLVAGYTAKGVYRNKAPEVYIDVTGVSELKQYEILDNVVLGGGVTLTEAMKYLTKASELEQFTYAKELVHHIDLIANVPVRNIGTLAGNLSIKYQNNEFPSDIFLIFEAVGAKICIVSEDGSKVSVTPSEYLKMDMKKKIILTITLPPIVGDFSLKTYKIMPRAQNAHAYVNAGFYIRFSECSPKIVEEATIVFGGINPEFIHASKTESCIVGKDLFDSTVLTSTFNTLNSELNPDWVLPDASPEYRRNLALSLFYKFVLNSSPPELVTPINKSGGEILSRGLSSGQQCYDTNKEVWPLNQPLQKVEAVAQCSGEAQYINDIPAIPGELFAAFVLATRPLANLVSLDASEALKIPGVKRLITAKDIPGKNVSIGPKLIGVIQTDVEILVSKKVLYNGQPCGIIVAESQNLAIQGAKLVKVDYEETDEKPLLSVRQALAKGDDKRFTKVVDVKPTEDPGTNVAKVIKGSFDMGGQYHYTMETQTCVCIPIEDGMDVYSATQWMDAVHVYVSEALGIQQSRINLHVRRLGGGYGAKINPPNYIATACAVAAYLTNKPVRMVLPLKDNMETIGKRIGCSNDYEVGVDANGKIQYLKTSFYQDFGCDLNDDAWIASGDRLQNCYDSKTWDYQGYCVLTDVAPNTWCRAPGSTEGIAMIENIMEHISHATGVDPVSVRLANMAEEDSRISEIVESFIPSIDYESRKTKVEEFNKENRWRKRGIAFVPMKYAFGFTGKFVALVSVYHADGTVSVSHGGIEMGQGINTKVAQVCAYTLGIPVEYVIVKPSNNLIAPNSTTSGGSIASESCCYAVMKACEILVERLAETKSSMDNPTWQELVEKADTLDINLSANYMFTTRDDVKDYSIWGVSAAEVEVDLLTGNLQILRVDILEDTGDSISPDIDVGQVEGAFIMGLGYWLNEQLIYDDDSGALLTNRTWNYKPPGAKDIPIDFRVQFLRNAPNPVGVLRSKATGEPPLCMSIVAIFALRNALKSAREDAEPSNTEWFNLGAPSTAEHVFLKSLNDYRQYTL